MYADSTAVIGPLPVVQEPHAWDLCAAHALRITAPRGWDLVRHPDLDTTAEDSDLTALLDAVTGAPVGQRRSGAALVDADRLRRLGVSDPSAALSSAGPADPATGPEPGRPHLRVVTDATAAPSADAGGPGDGIVEPGPAGR